MSFLESFRKPPNDGVFWKICNEPQIFTLRNYEGIAFKAWLKLNLPLSDEIIPRLLVKLR